MVVLFLALRKSFIRLLRLSHSDADPDSDAGVSDPDPDPDPDTGVSDLDDSRMR